MNKDKIDGIVNEVLLTYSMFSKDDIDTAYNKVNDIITKALTKSRNEGFLEGLGCGYSEGWDSGCNYISREMVDVLEKTYNHGFAEGFKLHYDNFKKRG